MPRRTAVLLAAACTALAACACPPDAGRPACDANAVPLAPAAGAATAATDPASHDPPSPVPTPLAHADRSRAVPPARVSPPPARPSDFDPGWDVTAALEELDRCRASLFPGCGLPFPADLDLPPGAHAQVIHVDRERREALLDRGDRRHDEGAVAVVETDDRIVRAQVAERDGRYVTVRLASDADAAAVGFGQLVVFEP